MAVENMQEVIDYINTNKDVEDVKSYVGGLVTPDRINSFLESDDGKKLLQPKLDSYHTKGLESWKTKNLDGLVSAKVKELHPDADPKDLAMKQLQAQFDKMQSDNTRKDLTNSALKIAQEKGLPTDLVDFFIGSDSETTNSNINKFIATMTAHDEKLKKDLVTGSNYTPPNDKKGNLSEQEKLKAEIRKSMGLK